MDQGISFGTIVKERRRLLGLTQIELGRRVGCAAITIRKIEADALRPSVQLAENLAMAFNIPSEDYLAFVRLARTEQVATPLPTPSPVPEEIGQEDLSGRAIRGYALGERVGVGGYGVVYRAVQNTVKRDVAVKIILPKYADRPDFIRRFEAEAQLVARLEHPHIVPLYDYWREPGVAYLVMRFLQGGSLAQALEKGPLERKTLMRLLEQICLGLHTAHRAGVIHRDMKPANVLLDEADNAYLADFGLAKVLNTIDRPDPTGKNIVIDSPAYISPEQIMAEPVKPQTDIYSLGVMLYELLTGQKPFSGPTPVAYIQQHLNERLPLLAATQNGDTVNGKQAIPTPLDIVIGRATAKDPRDRYPDILSLLADIRQALEPGSKATDLTVGQTTDIIPPHIAAMLTLPDLENPYKGLRPFSEADAADFFGRETLIQALLTRLAETDDLSRFLAVVGPSGSGKSSVVRAGLIPALRNGGVPGSEKWFITEMLPGPHPLAELEAALLRIAVNPPESLLDQLRQDERGLLQAVRRVLPPIEEDLYDAHQRLGGADQTELVLIIDQFEEIFTLVTDEAIRQHFLDSLVTAILDPHSPLRVIVTLRADFTDRPLQYIDFGDLVCQRTEFVLPLTPDELEEAIIQPTTRAGLSLEAGLAGAIIGEIGAEPSTLPLLQYALTELFERREGRLLTLNAYQASGGVLGALARRADEIYKSLDQTGQEAARQLFMRLITLGEGVEDTRRRVLRRELATIYPLQDEKSLSNSWPDEAQPDLSSPNGANEREPYSTLLDKVLDVYGRYRLLTFDHDPITRSPTVEVAHEALIREWRLLRKWLEANRADIRLQRLLASAREEWLASGKDDGFLLRGTRLDQFEGWAEKTDVLLTRQEQSFLEASLAARRARRAEEEARQRRELETAQKLVQTETRRAEERSRAARQLSWLAAGLALFLVVAIGAAWFALNQRNEARSNAEQAERNFETAERIRLAAQAQIALDQGEGGDLPALLALRSLKIDYSPEADAALQEALRRGFTRQRYLGHTDAVWNATFSSDGRYVLTASEDHTARLWETQSGQEVRQFSDQGDFINSAIFAPDGRTMLTGNLDGTAQLWDVQTGKPLRLFRGHAGSVWGGDFSPDGRFVLTVSNDHTARLWDVQSGQEVRQFVGHTDVIGWGEFSPDGTYIATASEDGTARLWDVQTGQEVRQFAGHTEGLADAVFSPHSQYLLTTSSDRTARLWDIQTGLEIRRFVGHTEAVLDAAFSPDGRSVLTSSHDKTARLWDVATGQEVRQFIGHTGAVYTVEFSPNGQYVLTGSVDGTARLWDTVLETEPRPLISTSRTGHFTSLTGVTVSSDGRYVLTGERNGIQLWHVPSGQIEQDIRLEAAIINAQTLSPDNKFILTGGNDGLTQLWNAQTGQMERLFSGHEGPVWEAIFSPDGRYILTAGEDQTARLWSVQTGREDRQFVAHTGPIRSLAFSNDGRQVLTGSEDQTARLWDVETGRGRQQFVGHAGVIHDVTFSADDRFILTGSEDGTAQLWDAKTGQMRQQFIGHTDQVLQVAFSPDSHSVLTGSADQTARLWDVQSGQEVRQFGGHISPLLFVGFSADGQFILTGDIQAAFLWRMTLEDITAFACSQLSRDLTTEERVLYNIADDKPACPDLAEKQISVEPTWTPVPISAPPTVPTLIPMRQPITTVVEMAFFNEAANIQMGAPIQEVFIDSGDDQVIRPAILDAETLAQPVYRAAIEVEPDIFEPPFDVGPYPKGEPLGFTLRDWIAATGHGTYTVSGNRAIIDLTFDHLVPNGIYTVWCVEFAFPPNFVGFIETPCGLLDGSENTFVANEMGHGEITIEIDAFPPSTPEAVYEIAIAYHSDGLTHGSIVGQHGFNAHAQMFFDFLPPEK